MKPITKSFFNKSTLEIARALLGCYLINKTNDGEIIGKIIETEAYLSNDPASHSFKGKTKRNSAMFGKAGKAYVYFTYGMHNCFNVVTAKEGIGEAVLIRALEPIKGIELMKKRRSLHSVGRKPAAKRGAPQQERTEKQIIKELCNGPAKLVQALGITKEHNGTSLLEGKLRLFKGQKITESQIKQTKRIGISKGINLPYRFLLKDGLNHLN